MNSIVQRVRAWFIEDRLSDAWRKDQLRKTSRIDFDGVAWNWDALRRPGRCGVRIVSRKSA